MMFTTAEANELCTVSNTTAGYLYDTTAAECSLGHQQEGCYSSHYEEHSAAQLQFSSTTGTIKTKGTPFHFCCIR